MAKRSRSKATGKGFDFAGRRAELLAGAPPEKPKTEDRPIPVVSIEDGELCLAVTVAGAKWSAGNANGRAYAQLLVDCPEINPAGRRRYFPTDVEGLSVACSFRIEEGFEDSVLAALGIDPSDIQG